MNDNLDAIFYNPDHTKTYSPSGKPTGVVMTDFDIMEAKQAIQSLINSEVASAVNGTLDRLEKKAETYHHNYTLNPRGHVITEAIPLEAINEERP